MDRKKDKPVGVNRRDALSIGGAVVASAIIPLSTQVQAKAAEQPTGEVPMFDPLTGLPGERLFYDRTESLMRLNLPGTTVAIIDIDDFETHRLRIGDSVLSAAILTLARRLERFQNMDRVHTVGRLGESQFGALIVEGERHTLAHSLESIRYTMRAPMITAVRDMVFTTSIGAIERTNLTLSHHELIAMACSAGMPANHGSQYCCILSGARTSHG